MVHVSTFFVAGLTLLSGVANALPRPDSSINEPAVSAPNGTPITAGSTPMATASSDSSMSSMGSSDMGSSGSMGSSDMGSSGSMSSSDMGSSGSMSSSDMGSSSSMSSSDMGSSDSMSSSDSSSSSYGGSSSSYGSGSSESSYGSGDMSSGSSYGSGGDSNSWASTTTTAWNSYSTPSYGSGSSSWSGSSGGYNDCVQQCVASYGGLNTATYMPTATNTASYGSGATHTVIVAPTQGVLRYVPFAVNASVGDTIKFMWGANNHTVTKSSELTPCNKTSDNLFTSGEQNKGFVFTQVVNDTNPTFFYCGTPTHCQKGMFGIINPPNAFQAPTSMSEMLPSLASNSSDIMAYSAYTKTQTKGNTGASSWGMNIDMGKLPEWSHSYLAENVMYTQNFLAANAEVLKTDGTIDLSASGSTPLMIPQDLSVALAASSATASAPAATATSSGTPSASGVASSAAPTSSNGAMSSSASKMTVGVVAAVGAFMML